MSQAVIEKEVNEIVQVANGIAVESNDQEAFAVEFLKIIAKGKKMVGEEFDQNVDDAYALHRSLTAQRKKYLDPLKEADDIVRGRVKAYRLKTERRRKEEEDKQKAILDTHVKLLQDKKMEEADNAMKSGDVEASNKLVREAFSIEAGGVMVPGSAVKQEGMSSRIIWKGRVLDVNKLPRQFQIIAADQKAIDAFAQKNNGLVPIEGVEMYQDVDMRIRS